MLAKIFSNFSDFLYLIPVILISLTFHEFSHAYVSYRLGDPTAKNQGRLTLNPFKHLDLFGTIMMIVARIGWAKPVPINPIYYKDRKKGTMLVSIAGPLSNILLAFIFAFPRVYIEGTAQNPSWLIIIIYNLSYLFFFINIRLAVFNIIPVPPLDGSKILSGVLPSRQYFKLMQYENYIGIIFLIIVFVFPNQFSTILRLISAPIEYGILNIVKPIVNLFI